MHGNWAYSEYSEKLRTKEQNANGRLNDAAIGLALPLKKPSKVNDVIGTTTPGAFWPPC